jgi:VIT1/CCC1 family predicted Fe2+/Mn2+ transporter
VSRFTARSWWFNGLRQLAFGVIAAGATFIVGSLIGVGGVG